MDDEELELVIDRGYIEKYVNERLEWLERYGEEK